MEKESADPSFPILYGIGTFFFWNINDRFWVEVYLSIHFNFFFLFSQVGMHSSKQLIITNQYKFHAS